MSKSRYHARFSRYKHFCVLQFLRKNAKIQNGHNIWLDKFILKFGMDNLQIYPVGKNFVEITLSSTVLEI